MSFAEELKLRIEQSQVEIGLISEILDKDNIILKSANYLIRASHNPREEGFHLEIGTTLKNMIPLNETLLTDILGGWHIFLNNTSQDAFLNNFIEMLKASKMQDLLHKNSLKFDSLKLIAENQAITYTDELTQNFYTQNLDKLWMEKRYEDFVKFIEIYKVGKLSRINEKRLKIALNLLN